MGSYERIHASRGPRHERTQEALDLIIELYGKWNRPVLAARYVARRNAGRQ